MGTKHTLLEEEIGYIDLGDERSNRRLSILLEQLTQMPCSSIPEACGTKASTKAAYRFFDQERVSVRAIQEGFFRATGDRIKGTKRVIVAQDTTNLDFTAHAKTRGLGYLDDEACSGIKMHSALVISENGVPLGLVAQHYWVRRFEEYGKKKNRRKKKTVEKESQRWLSSVEETEKHIEEGTAIVTVADREADAYDLFAQHRRPKHDLVVRVCRNRSIKGEHKLLYDKVLSLEKCGVTEISISRSRDRKARKAVVEVRYTQVEIQPPQYRAMEHLPAIVLWVMSLEEVDPPAGAQPIHWMLMTTMPVTMLDDALQCVHWYTMRWLIERYHYTLKSGCQVEELQLEEAERIERAVAVYCIVAWRLLFLTYLARLHPDQLSTTVLDKEEVNALSCFIRRSKEPSEKLPTIEEAVRMIAQLGGFLGRKGDGFPGVKVLWRGFRRLNDFFIAYQIFKDVGNA